MAVWSGWGSPVYLHRFQHLERGGYLVGFVQRHNVRLCGGYLKWRVDVQLQG